MENREAIETIKVAAAEVEWNYPMDYAEAFEKAVEALGKQIAKPPTQIEDEDELCVRYECPACGGFLMQLEARRMKSARRTPMRWPRFCECGQRINWEVR